MKEYHGTAQLAQDMGVSTDTLARTFAQYTKTGEECKAKQTKDQFGKEPYNFFSLPWQPNDTFFVAEIGPTVHYTMGGIAADERAQVLSASSKRPIPGLYCAGEVMGGIHGENRLGGSSLLDCVVFGRISGAEASKYLLEELISGSAQRRVQTMVNQLTPAAPSYTAKTSQDDDVSGPKVMKSFTAAEVAKHKTADDCWVVLENKVYNVTDFLDDHPGGKGAILLYGGKDATKEFLMLHKPEIITKYGGKYLIGELKDGASASSSSSSSSSSAAAATAASASASSSGGGLNMNEVAKHNSQDDCYVVIKDQVYDVTGFLDDHPGGKGALLMYAGKNATEEFEMLHKPEILDKYGKKYLKGKLQK